MLHFPSSFSSSSGPNGHVKRADGLNATQSRSQSNPLLLKIEEELHDARRVQSHGQEEDLRAALSMVINRVTEMSSLLNEAYKTQAELEVQLNVTKSNLQLIISNNEMLEDALKRESNGHSRDVGWRRRSGRDIDQPCIKPYEGGAGTPEERSKSLDLTSDNTTTGDSNAGSSVTSPVVPATPPAPASASQDSRFFRFRFTGASSGTPSRPSTRPTTPSGSKGPVASVGGAYHLTSPSMPSLPTHTAKEVEDLMSELDKERAARKNIAQEKASLEAELESLSQALFEEANKMVATERMKRAETEEELREARLEQEALRSALRCIEGENSHLRGGGGSKTAPPSISASPNPNTIANSMSQPEMPLIAPRTRLRSSSQVALKSPISSPRLRATNTPTPPIPSPEREPPAELPKDSQSESTSETRMEGKSDDASFASTMPISSHAHLSLPQGEDGIESDYLANEGMEQASSGLYEDIEPSPWADVPPRMTSASVASSGDLPSNSFLATGSVYSTQ
ncbi:hypothetical protein AX17_004039 [Amanita inopinata Kibby_2008]|nr:hypothetical protein AX17_004039 [Amanita inopinata Kibby_2008]